MYGLRYDADGESLKPIVAKAGSTITEKSLKPKPKEHLKTSRNSKPRKANNSVIIEHSDITELPESDHIIVDMKPPKKQDNTNIHVLNTDDGPTDLNIDDKNFDPEVQKCVKRIIGVITRKINEQYHGKDEQMEQFLTYLGSLYATALEDKRVDLRKVSRVYMDNFEPNPNNLLCLAILELDQRLDEINYQ